MFKALVSGFVAIACFSAMAAPSKMTYFSCVVKEPVTKTKSVKVTVKFAVKNFSLGLVKNTGTLVQYPGLGEEDGYISVTPNELPNKKYSIMSNLNAQGGDLRLEGNDLRLFGDGDGYQFTDLVIWDADSDEEEVEGYVRDYGSAYGDTETFKQFIKCVRSNKVL